MISAKLGLQLHDRATRGEALTLAEQTQLQDWYDAQDAEEAAWLRIDKDIPDTSHLQAQVSATLDQLTEATQQIQTVTAENEALRKEISALYQQLDLTQSA